MKKIEIEFDIAGQKKFTENASWKMGSDCMVYYTGGYTDRDSTHTNTSWVIDMNNGTVE